MSRDTNERIELTRRTILGAAGAGFVGTGFASASGGSPADGGDGGDGGGGGTPGDTSGPTHEYTVTLITGHTIHVEERDETRLYTIERGDEPLAYDLIEGEDGTYFIPDYVDTSTYAEHLFNIDFLIDQDYTDAETDVTPVFVREAQSGVSTFTQNAGADTFRSSDVVAVDVPKEDVLINDTQTFSKATGLDRVFLNPRDELTMDVSGPAVAAPATRDAFDVTGDGIVVGVVDSGIDDAHPDLEGRVVDAENFAPDDTQKDLNGHGTLVSGAIGGDGTEGDGEYVGIAPEAEFVDARVFDETGSAQRDAIVDAVEWAVYEADPQPDVLNLSIGGSIVDEEDPLAMALNEAVTEEGIFVTVSAGNEQGFFPDYETLTNPAQAEHVTSVGASDHTGDEVDIADFSSWGPTPFDQAVKPELVAPGVDITAAGSEPAGLFPYAEASGTSFSAPIVAGAAALALEHHTDADPLTLRDRMVSTANPIAPIEEVDPFAQGAGELDIYDAIASDIRIEDTVHNFGYIDEPTDGEATITVHNTGDEAVTLEPDAAMYEIDNEERIDEQVSVNPDELTIEAGSTASFSLTAAFPDFGRYVGAFEMTDGEATYRSIFGGVVAIPVEIEATLHEDSILDVGEMETFILSSHDGELYETGDLQVVDEDTARGQFLMNRQSATVDVWTTGQIASEEPVLAVKSDVTVDADDHVISTDHNETSRRAFDLELLPHDGPFQDEDTDYQLYHRSVGSSFSRGFTGGFDVFAAHYGEIAEDDFTTLGQGLLFAPAEQVPEEEFEFADATQAPNVYHLVETSETHQADDVTIDPTETLARYDMAYYFAETGPDPAPAASPHWFPADLDTFPRTGSSTFAQDIQHEDQTWYFTSEGNFEYSFEDNSDFDEELVEYTFPDRNVPEAGTVLETTLGEHPLFAGQTHWDPHDSGWIRTAPYRDQGAISFSNYHQDYSHPTPSLLRFAVDGETLVDVDYIGSAFNVHQNLADSGYDVPELFDEAETVTLETLSRTLEPYVGVTSELIHDVTVDGTDTPPQLASVDICGLTRDNELGSREVVAVAELDADAAIDTFEAAVAPASAIDRPDESDWASDGQRIIDDDAWQSADVIAAADERHAIRFDATDLTGDALAIAIEVTDVTGNYTAATTVGSCPVVAWAEDTIAIDVRPDEIDAGSNQKVVVAIDGVDANDIETLRFGSPDAVEAGEGASPERLQQLGNGTVQAHFRANETGYEADGTIVAAAIAAELVDGTLVSGADAVEQVKGT